jgi:peptidoglycan/LPS O-acetylase OafA/YrhL
MKIKSQRDFWAGMLFLIVGMAFAWAATAYTFGSSAKPGPAYFPFGLGLLLALLGAIELFKALTFEREGGDPIAPVAWRSLLLVVAAVAGFGYLLPRLGLFITLPLVVVLVSMAGDEQHWKDVAISAAVLTLGSWVVFVKGLNLALPLAPTIFG